MTSGDADAATRELVAVYGTQVLIDGHSRAVFVDEENESPEYDDGGAQVDASTLIIIGTSADLENVRIKSTAEHRGRKYRVVERNTIPGGVQLTLLDSSSR
ncbi:MAG: hypothetical protein ACO3LT_08445 [Ilumatobacteraceae bacterium]